MEERSLRITGTNTNFFNRLTKTLTKLLIPTKIGINGMLITLKRNNLIKAFENYKKDTENYNTDELEKKYDEAYTVYLEALDKYVMDSIYKKVKNNTATEFERDALSRYYEVTSLKEKEYMDFTKKSPKHQKQILSEKDKSAGRPEMDIEAYLDMRKALESKALYEEKLALDNPEHEIYNYAFENNEMRMAAFEEYERLNRDVIQEKKSRYLDPEIHESLKNVDMQYPDTESNTQIEEAEEQIFAQDREKEMEHLYGDRDWDRTDVGYDKNNNWIPDEYEKN